MTKALWMLIQKQSCSSCVIFVGSTFSSRCIRDLDAVEIFYQLKPCIFLNFNSSTEKPMFLLFFSVAYLIVSSIFDAYSNLPASICILGTMIMPMFCSLFSFWYGYRRGLVVASKVYRGLQLSLRRLGEKVLEDETE